MNNINERIGNDLLNPWQNSKKCIFILHFKTYWHNCCFINNRSKQALRADQQELSLLFKKYTVNRRYVPIDRS